METRRNIDTRKKVELKLLGELLEDKQLSWFEHLVRTGEEEQVKNTCKARSMEK